MCNQLLFAVFALLYDNYAHSDFKTIMWMVFICFHMLLLWAKWSTHPNRIKSNKQRNFMLNPNISSLKVSFLTAWRVLFVISVQLKKMLLLQNHRQMGGVSVFRILCYALSKKGSIESAAATWDRIQYRTYVIHS